LVPAPCTWPPAANIAAILFVICPEFPAQSWFFVKDYEQIYRERSGCHGSDHSWVRVSEYNPEPDPTDCETQVHWIPHEAVETDYY
jgi:hypothetical protein